MARRASSLTLAPSGLHYAVYLDGRSENRGPRFQVGDFAGSAREIEASDLGFLSGL